MANSMLTGVSGLKSHQKMIEVVGNNLANLNTVGYKQRTAVFADVLYETVRAGSSGTPGVSGGTNPIQIGTGSKLSAIRTNMQGGGMESTGGDLDLALDGAGFFVVNNGSSNLYTRAGAFQIDQKGLLVDSSTGYPVQRFGTKGEDNVDAPSFQIPGDSSIHIPLGANVPGKATDSVALIGQLPANGKRPLAQILTSAAWTAGGAPATSATLLNSLSFVSPAYQAGDSLAIQGTDSNGSPINVSLAVTATTTVGDLVSAINAAFPDATATLDASGSLSLTADSASKSFLTLTLGDAPGNVGGSDFSTQGFVVATAGQDGEVVRGGFQTYDASGGVHTVNFELTKQLNGTWDMQIFLDPSEGAIVDGSVRGITFNDDGSFQGVAGSGTGDANLSIQFTGRSVPQVFTVVFDGGGVSGASLSSLAGEGSIATVQDGYGNGILTGVQVDSSGIIQGIASNGVEFPLAQLAIGSFRNPEGLEAVGTNYFKSSLSSGDVRIGGAGASGNGLVRAGQLEQSNVDVATEFTRLIVAQRGFSANARTITVTNDILQELTNLIR